MSNDSTEISELNDDILLINLSISSPNLDPGIHTLFLLFTDAGWHSQLAGSVDNRSIRFHSEQSDKISLLTNETLSEMDPKLILVKETHNLDFIRNQQRSFQIVFSNSFVDHLIYMGLGHVNYFPFYSKNFH